jgi:hypothetical protein
MWVIMTTHEDGSTGIWGTPRSGRPFPSQASAEKIAKQMEDPHSAMYIDADVSVTPICRPWS